MVAWPWFVALQPIGGVVFALDGVLIGAGDVRYLRNLTIVAALGGFLPAIWLAYALDLGLGGIWAGLTLFVVLRLVGPAAAAALRRLGGGRRGPLTSYRRRHRRGDGPRPGRPRRSVSTPRRRRPASSRHRCRCSGRLRLGPAAGAVRPVVLQREEALPIAGQLTF